MNTNLAIEQIDLSNIHPYPGNPRKTDAAIEPVAKSIQEYGFRQPIVVDADMTIVVGHVRYYAAQRLGLSQIPVHIAKDLTSAQAKAFRIADNRTAEYSEWDTDLLDAELAALSEMSVDLGYFDLDDIIAAVHETGEAGQGETPAFAPVDVSTQPRLDRKKPVTCPECGHAFTVR